MSVTREGYVISGRTGLPFEEVVERARSLLAEAGYGVLCEIDVAAKLKEKLGVEREPYVILGACNPPLANEALGAEPDLGALLPCNLAVYRQDGRTVVAAVEPETMLSVVGNEKLDPIARRVRGDFERIVGELTGGEE
ncbi:MAG: DUF302 domain-containing protein [Rubrobacteraceae bacterium]|uniref:DUF302 domain-containing protein n=1 Tax=Rubrobacter naiadicus TaxID=1392641 RepID=UPI0023614D7D|nr:DUF302 domain-containing protein [Rubrobacter naiadicus]MBX6764158.1 DUF302 domain-containing protein [Rubrobacteraceae bacterium]MCL6437056.1 DUF302 domain-containing protein [Rubrobacteraceae bacterium]